MVDWKIVLLVLAAILCGSQDLAAQELQIGIIDFYGLNRVTLAQAREALTFKEGDSISVSGRRAPPTVAESEIRLSKLPGVVRARTNLVCCDNGRVIVYVGIEERGAPTMRLRAEPAGKARLAADLVAGGRRVFEGVRAGDPAWRLCGEIDPKGTLCSPIPRRVPFRNASSSMRSAICRSCVSCCEAHPTPHSECWRRKCLDTRLTSRRSWTISCTR